MRRSQDPILLDRDTIQRIYSGELHCDNAPKLYQQLMASDDLESEAFFMTPANQPIVHELEPQEADEVLANVLQGIALRPSTAAAKPTVTAPPVPTATRWWARLVQGFIFAPTLAITAVLVLVPVWWSQRTLQQPSATHSFGNTLKSASKGAYLEIEVHRTQQQKPKRRVFPFVAQGRYRLGDAMTFSFLITKPGYLSLLREDQRGNIEQLYPFQNKVMHVRPGSVTQLKYNGKPMAYFLDKALLGAQTLHLVHTPRPVVFPKHTNDLRTQQKEWIKRAETVRFIVEPTPKP